ncbi:MAG: MFS transporter [Aquabacterium sp.]|uniref:MFS transporter n=1 Tax=Aquabacterium sp. TaxID=1872578 RepID=UPI00271AD6D6|nr:MFS transporter [Aquabacterium sp.]MDO9004965.1 MFS transporter [Aquabacterium sp.]
MYTTKNYHWRIAGFYFFYYAFVGMFSPYWSLYLQSIHFDAIEISILMSIQPVMRMVAPNIWGWLADHTGKRLLVVQVAASLSALFYLGVFATTDFWGLFLVLALMSFFWSASMPLVEATTLSYLGKNTAHYGRIRSWGSIGFIVSVVGLGYAFDYIAIAWLLWAGLVCEVGILIFSRQIPKTEVLAHHTDHQPIRQILLQPRVLALFGACFLMSVAHGPYYTFFSIYLVEHGYAKSVVGGLWALGVICEIGVFFLMPALVRRFGFTRILLVSFSAAVLRFLLIGWAVDVVVLLLLAQVLHALSFGAFHAASVGLVHQFFQGRHQSRGQALYGSFTYGAGGMLGGLASGPIWQHWGASALYTFSAGMALAGLLLMWWKLRNMENARAPGA